VQGEHRIKCSRIALGENDSRSGKPVEGGTRRGRVDVALAHGCLTSPLAALVRAVTRWRDRLGEIPSTARLAAWQESGLRLIVPEDAEWPTQLDDLGDARPIVMWLQGAERRLGQSTAQVQMVCVRRIAK
jgi:DNA processing protein